MSLKEWLDKGSILDSMGLGVFAVDREWTIVFFSREAERITGFSSREAVGAKCWEVFCTECCNHRCYLQKAIRQGRSETKRRVHFVSREGRRIPLEITASVLRDAQGRVLGGVECFSDKLVAAPVPPQASSAEIIGRSRPMQRLYATLGAVSRTDASVLLTGETGTGKGLFARAIHANSTRRAGPFVDVNCAALPENLLESELFGYRKGAFTGADRDKPGLFEAASGGTIFLDEIGDLPAALQAKLLQALEDGRFHPLGSVKPVQADVRVISATNRDLRARVAAGTFRSDLYYRLRVLEIELPPLRERPGDCDLLTDHFVHISAARYGIGTPAVSKATRRALAACRLPGNVRELKHAVEHAVILCQGRTIEPAHLPAYILGAPEAPPRPAAEPQARTIQERERAMLQEALADHGYSVLETCRALGVSRTTLWRKMKKHGL
ncbi:Arginine utilization regulatory protein RocR [Fundidesulfovibrio magnetotacticus]|uniref:Arginine utilization regulatory protein RocR n=1 Tax=Fundidesulfovibrio magnetotacticus TaxID=2730080 RepID=A0A6V8LRV8_9BACT|nr:sigma 54-interacting transcriptional regulator [Fundidesulfovibrio magnetotacticus]GFK94464.1 Arginine utilization regulatory protein RocR [Fundidesulfovibrio magnetotacticus]